MSGGSAAACLLTVGTALLGSFDASCGMDQGGGRRRDKQAWPWSAQAAPSQRRSLLPAHQRGRIRSPCRGPGGPEVGRDQPRRDKMTASDAALDAHPIFDAADAWDGTRPEPVAVHGA